MSPYRTLVVLTGLLGLLTGCESDGGIAARTREKSAVYATLKLSEKRFIEKGVIAVGFTPDMVYMAMGKPTKVEVANYPEGKRELWTYSRYYPNGDSVRGYRPPTYSTQAPYQRALTQDRPDGDPHSNFNPQIPAGMDKGQGPSLFKGGPVQGNSSSEPPELQSYTFTILFQHDRVNRFEVVPNMN